MASGDIMKAWKITSDGISMQETSSQSVRDGQLKIKTKYTLIGVLDKYLYDTRSERDGIVPSRQCIGMVSEVGGDGKSIARGDIVAVKPYSACGECIECEEGRASDCENKLVYGYTADGFLRDFVVVNTEDVLKLPERVDPKSALFIEHIDMAIDAFDKLGAKKGEHVVIVGANEMGLILAQAVLYYQMIPIVVDIDSERLKRASEYVYYTVNASTENAIRRIFNITGGRMGENVVYVARGAVPLSQSMMFAGNNGKVAIVGWKKTVGLSDVNISAVIDKKLTIVGVCGSNDNFPKAINLLATKAIKVDFDIPEVKFEQADKVFKEFGDSDGFVLSRITFE